MGIQPLMWLHDFLQPPVFFWPHLSFISCPQDNFFLKINKQIIPWSPKPCLALRILDFLKHSVLSSKTPSIVISHPPNNALISSCSTFSSKALSTLFLLPTWTLIFWVSGQGSAIFEMEIIVCALTTQALGKLSELMKVELYNLPTVNEVWSAALIDWNGIKQNILLHFSWIYQPSYFFKGI